MSISYIIYLFLVNLMIVVSSKRKTEDLEKDSMSVSINTVFNLYPKF